MSNIQELIKSNDGLKAFVKEFNLVVRDNELVSEDPGSLEKLRAFMAEHRLVVQGTKLIPADAAAKTHLTGLETFWDQRQQARKILLNSLYGALLNEGLRFYDERLGQSTTLTGRSIVRHMNATTNAEITGEYDYTGRAIVYADTDSCYFSVYEALHDDPQFADFPWDDRDAIIDLYDSIAERVNDSFPSFMDRTFNTGLDRGAIIKAGRELVASMGLFIKKKKYAVLMYDKDGTRLDVDGKPGKLKAMGLDLKRADTPKVMQKFMEKILMDLLTGVDRQSIYADVRQFRKDFKLLKPWEKGSPKAVKGLAKYSELLDRKHSVKPTDIDVGKIKNMIPGHVTASINWNKLCVAFHDKYATRISDGARIVVCRLKNNNYTMMDAVAYPIDEPHLPEWLKKLPFDEERMEETIIDKKLDNLLGVLEWDLETTKELVAEDIFVFPESFSKKKKKK